MALCYRVFNAKALYHPAPKTGKILTADAHGLTQMNYTPFEFKPAFICFALWLSVASLERVHLRLQQTAREDMRIIPLKVSCWP